MSQDAWNDHPHFAAACLAQRAYAIGRPPVVRPSLHVRTSSKGYDFYRDPLPWVQIHGFEIPGKVIDNGQHPTCEAHQMQDQSSLVAFQE